MTSMCFSNISQKFAVPFIFLFLFNSNAANAQANNVIIDNSTVSLPAQTYSFDSLTVRNGSTVNWGIGSGSFRTQTNTFGTLNISNSTFSFINGQTGDRLEIGNLTLNNAIFGTDINAAAGTGDQLIVNGDVTLTGSASLNVNSTDGTLISQTVIIPLGPVAGEVAPTANTATTSLFNVTTTDTAGLNTYQLAFGSGGGVYLVVTPNQTAHAHSLTPKIAIDSRPPNVVSREVSSLTGDAIDAAMETAGDTDSRAGGQITPLFGIFASGNAGRLLHDGFDVSSSGGTIAGPDFTANEFSTLISLEYDIAKGFDLGGPVNAKAGLFGGLATTDVDVGTSAFLTGLGFGRGGSAQNRSGIFGGYGLASHGTNYALLAGTGFFGTTDTRNDVYGSVGSYGTRGYAISGSIGKILSLGKNTKLDLRSSALWAQFFGDAHVDSQRNSFGSSEVSFGALKFQPGVFTNVAVGDVVLQPFVRGELATRLGYENSARVLGTNFDFEDSDLSGTISSGVTAKVSSNISLKAEGAWKYSGDLNSITGKLGLKIRFGQ